MIRAEITLKELQPLTPIQDKLLELLREKGPLSRREICETFGFTQYTYEHSFPNPNARGKPIKHHVKTKQYHKRTTIYDNLQKLEKQNLVEKFSRNNGKRGRPLVYWKIKKLEK